MCTVTLAEIDKVCGPNIPGNILLYVANADELITVPAVDVGTHTVSTDVTFDTGGRWWPFVFDKKSCQHTEEEQENGQVLGTVTCFFSHDDDAKRKLFMDMTNGDFALCITDGNSLTKLVPSGVEFSRNFDSGLETADKNGYQVTFTYEGTPAYIYTGAISTTPAA